MIPNLYFDDPQCDYLHCLAGQGLAGRCICFLGGDPRQPDCRWFKSETAWYLEKRWIYENEEKYGGEMEGAWI